MDHNSYPIVLCGDGYIFAHREDVVAGHEVNLGCGMSEQWETDLAFYEVLMTRLDKKDYYLQRRRNEVREKLTYLRSIKKSKGGVRDE